VESTGQELAPGALVERLRQAVDDHDLDALSACFAADYRNETPVHPARGFDGPEQVRKNWEQIFAAVPDLQADVRWIADDSTVWSEWDMHGTRRDGAAHHLRGVVIFGVNRGQAHWARFYLEPVDASEAGIDETIRQALSGQEATR
jgi:ketosteroid isomerase-like protein